MLFWILKRMQNNRDTSLGPSNDLNLNNEGEEVN